MTAKWSCLSECACVLDCGGCDAAFLRLVYHSHIRVVRSLQKPLETFRRLLKGKIKNHFSGDGQEPAASKSRFAGRRRVKLSPPESSPVKLSQGVLKNYLCCRADLSRRNLRQPMFRHINQCQPPPPSTLNYPLPFWHLFHIYTHKFNTDTISKRRHNHLS
jgi:hypothetical protein